MPINLLKLLPHVHETGNREGREAVFQTHVPWVAPLAYLHIIFKPAAEDALLKVAREVNMPVPLREFLTIQNGAILFSGAVSVYGVHREGQLLDRTDPFARLPYNIIRENKSWVPRDAHRFLSIGGYEFDGSRACMARDDCRIYLFSRGKSGLVPEPSMAWDSLELWITGEIRRLSKLFDSQGRLLADHAETLPISSA